MKKAIISVLLSIGASGCGSSGDDGDASSEALAPLITFPANGATVDGPTEVRVDIDESDAYGELILLVNGIEVASDSEKPYSFEWNPYFVADGDEASLVVKASYGGDTVRSDAISIYVDRALEPSQASYANDEFVREYPFGTDEVDVSWAPIIGADKYEYSIRGEATKAAGNTATVELEEGRNVISVRASANDQWGQWLELPVLTVLSPLRPVVTTSTDENGLVDASIDLDARAPTTRIALVVATEEVLSISNPGSNPSGWASTSLIWDPYFWADNAFTEWWFDAILEDGRTLRSDVQIISNEEVSYGNRISVALPSGGPNFRDVDQLTISWTPITNAVTYEYQLNGSVQPSNTSEVVLEDLDPGTYGVKVRAVNASGNAGPWSEIQEFSIAVPGAPSIVSPASNVAYRDVGSITVEWEPVQGVSSYEYQMGNEWITTTETSFQVATPSVGSYSVAVRALDSLGRGGESAFANFEILKPEPPEIEEPTISWNQDQFEVEITWAEQDGDNTYILSWSGKEYETQSNSLVISAAVAGTYSWNLQRVNAFGHISTANFRQTPVGVFRTQLGGTRNEEGTDLFRSVSGGYIILATTASRELDPEVNISSNQPAPWIIRLDESGNVLNKLILPSPERVTDYFEVENGTLYLSGYDWQAATGFIYKLNSEFEVEWKESYAAEVDGARFDLIQVVHNGSELVVIGATWKTEGTTTFRDRYGLLRVNAETGVLMDRLATVDSIDSSEVDTLSKLTLSSEGKILVAGTLESTDFMSVPAFLAELSADLEVSRYWVSKLNIFSNVGDLRLGSDNTAVVFGQNFGDYGAAIIDLNTFTQVATDAPDSNLFYNANTNIAVTDTGGVIALLSDTGEYSYPHPLVLVELDSNLLELDRHYLLDEYGSGGVRESAVVRNPDGSLTILFSQGQSGGFDNMDLVIKRFAAP